jgi:hypothetical protein
MNKRLILVAVVLALVLSTPALLVFWFTAEVEKADGAFGERV